jgi:hypothetical protein
LAEREEAPRTTSLLCVSVANPGRCRSCVFPEAGLDTLPFEDDVSAGKEGVTRDISYFSVELGAELGSGSVLDIATRGRFEERLAMLFVVGRRPIHTIKNTRATAAGASQRQSSNHAWYVFGRGFSSVRAIAASCSRQRAHWEK